MALMMACRWLK